MNKSILHTVFYEQTTELAHFFPLWNVFVGVERWKKKKMQLRMGAAICWGHSVDQPALCGFVYVHQDETSTLVYI